VRTGPWLGRELELDVGAVAPGGHCVARAEGRVVFVRHALPGERVVARVTEDRGGSYCRADAIRVLAAAADRVTPPCPHAGPGRCGGCDWQHATGAAQRAGKASVLREQLSRLAGRPDVPVVVEPLPAAGGPAAGRAPDGTGAGDLLGWRTRVRFAVGADGRTGLRRHRSHRLEPVQHCPLGTAGVAATGFWQVHPAAADTLAGCVLDFLRPAPGETALDLYAGAGLFAGLLATAVGPAGRVVAVEADPRAAADAAGNVPGIEVRAARVTPGLLGGLGLSPHLVVLDPPRSGAGAAVMAALLALAPRAVAYVACDPATLARDLRVALDAGWELRGLRAFDCFPMTHHVEAVALLEPPR
jgi:tRNA/tmRNA/rRNA uracil-C5-methylase (TrmA/RlmC/RlmD family)